MKKFLISILLILCSLFTVTYNCKVFASENSNIEFDFSTYSQFNIINENYFFCVNITNNEIIKVENGTESSFDYGNTIGKFTTIKFFKVLNSNQIIVIDSVNRLHFFDTNFNHLKTIQYVLENEQSSTLGNIISYCSDIYANVYLLDSQGNRIIKANSQSEYAELYQSNINSDVKIIDFNINAELILATENKILFNNLETDLEGIENVYIDALNLMYVKTATTIYKYSTTLNQENSLSLPEYCSYLTLNIEDGCFYYINTNTNEILKIENFASDVSNYTPPFNILDGVKSNYEIKTATISKDCYLYSTPYQISSSVQLAKDYEIIILSENFDINLHFTYIMLTQNENVVLGYINSDCYTYITSTHITEPAFPIRKDIPYYKLPLKEYNSSSLKLGTLDIQKTYETNQKISFNGLEFYEIKLDDYFVFVESKNVLQNTNDYIGTYFEPNAVVKTINDEKNVKIYSDTSKTTVLYTTEVPLNIKSIRKIDSLYEIQFLLNNKIETGYVESANLFKNKDNFIIPIVIALVFLCLIIILIILLKFKKEFKRNI